MDTLTKKYSITMLTVIIGLSIFIHILPFITRGSHPLGYDTGFYRRYVIQEFRSFPNTPVIGFGKDAIAPRIFLDILRVLRLPTDILLYGGYIFLFAMSVAAFFFLIKHYWGAETGLFASLLFVTSPIQYTAYWFMLYKQIFAVLVLFLTFLAIEKRSRFAFPLGIIISLSHQTTTIIFLLTLALFFLLNQERRRETAFIFASVLMVFLYLHLDLSFIKQAPVAVFLTYIQYLTLSIPLFVLAVFGLKAILSKQKSILFSFALVVIAFPLLFLPFYERIFIFTDVVFISIAAVGLKKEEEKADSPHTKVTALSLIILALALGWFWRNVYNQIQNLQPAISQTAIRELNHIAEYIPNDASILTPATLAPWVYGWSIHRVIAPGLLNDWHTEKEWTDFWNTKNPAAKIQFLADFPRPLYLFIDTREKEGFIPKLNCIIEHTQFIMEYTC